VGNDQARPNLLHPLRFGHPHGSRCDAGVAQGEVERRRDQRHAKLLADSGQSTGALMWWTATKFGKGSNGVA